MTDPTERMAADDLLAIITDYDSPWDAPQEMVRRLTAQGYGHQSDILRAFAEWYTQNCEHRIHDCEVSAYLASLAEDNQR